MLEGSGVNGARLRGLDTVNRASEQLESGCWGSLGDRVGRQVLSSLPLLTTLSPVLGSAPGCGGRNQGSAVRVPAGED